MPMPRVLGVDFAFTRVPPTTLGLDFESRISYLCRLSSQSQSYVPCPATWPGRDALWVSVSGYEVRLRLRAGVYRARQGGVGDEVGWVWVWAMEKMEKEGDGGRVGIVGIRNSLRCGGLGLQAALLVAWLPIVPPAASSQRKSHTGTHPVCLLSLTVLLSQTRCHQAMRC
jgi:hypothetical protein